MSGFGENSAKSHALFILLFERLRRRLKGEPAEMCKHSRIMLFHFVNNLFAHLKDCCIYL